MDKFVEAEFKEMDRRTMKELARKFGTSMNQIRKVDQDIHRNDKVYLNDTYQVNVTKEETGWGTMIHLSIKRRDKRAIHDWRDLQEIKNQLVGPEHEGVELYPAEGRRVDTANQYHIFVMPDTDTRFPFGFESRKVMDGDGEIGVDGTRQRPL